MSFGPSAALHPSHTLRCGSRPLTAAGGQGPLDNTAYGPCIFTPYIKPALQSPSFVVDWICRDWAAISSIVLRPSGSLHPSHTCGVVPARLRPRVARVLRTTPLTACAYPLMHTPACPAASAGAVPQKLSALLPPLALHLWFSAYGLVNIRNGRPVPSPLDLHGKQRAWKRPMYLSVESAQPPSPLGPHAKQRADRTAMESPLRHISLLSVG